jgi:multiple sugar transport system ATP-binding protein
VVVMNAGTIEQVGAPNDLYHGPRTRFVAGFIGSPAMNFMKCRLEGHGDTLTARLSDKLSFPIPAGRTASYRPFLSKELVFGLRPEHITEARPHQPGTAEFTMPVEVVEPMGMETMIYFSVDGTEISARVDPAAARGVGEPMRFAADLRHMHLIDPETNLVIEVPANQRGGVYTNGARATA